jgi:hypothetical protein
MTDLRAKASAGVCTCVSSRTRSRARPCPARRSRHRVPSQGPAGPGFLEGRSGRGGARDQGLREDERQARGDPRVPRRPRAVRQGHRQGCFAADREQALSMLLGVLKAPIEKFVRTVAAPHTKLVRTIAAVRDQKQARPEPARFDLSHSNIRKLWSNQMAVSKDDILDAISKMSVIEVVELISDMEKKFGVTAAAPVAVAPVAAGGCRCRPGGRADRVHRGPQGVPGGQEGHRSSRWSASSRAWA